MKTIRYLCAVCIALALLCVGALADETVTWGPVAWGSIEENEVIAITMSKEGTTWVLTTANGSSAAPPAATVTVSNNRFTTDGVGAMGWKFASSGSGYTFTANDGSGKLYCENSNNGVRVGTGEGNVFTVSSDGYLQNAATSRYIGVYGNQDWRCYTSINSNIAGQTLGFWHMVDADSGDEPASTYTVSFAAMENGTAAVYEASDTGYDAGTELHISVTPDTGFRLTSLSYLQAGLSAATTLGIDDIDATGMYCLTMPDRNITVTAVFAPINAWNTLQEEIYSAEDGDTLTLTENVTADSRDVALVFPADRGLTLDLNGHTIDRALTSAIADGSAIIVRGMLTVTDSASGGVITGGCTTGSGGGISMEANAMVTLEGGTVTGNTAKYGGGVNLTSFADLTVDGGVISGNTATNHGAGVYLETDTFLTLASGSISNNTAARNGGGVYGGQYTTFDMTGGTLSGNSAAQSGALRMLENSEFNMTGGTITGNQSTDVSKPAYVVYVVSGGVFKISGSPRIYGNLDSSSAVSNVFLPSLCTMQVTGALTSDALIYVSTADTPTEEEAVAVTKDWNNRSEVSCFASDAGWFVTEDSQEIKLFVADPGTIFDVIISDGIEYGTVTADMNRARAGGTVTLTCAAEYGYRLNTLTVTQDGTDVTVENGQFIMPEGSVTVSASFVSVLTNVTYINQNGVSQTVQAVPLMATDTAMPGGAYAVLENLTMSAGVSFAGDSLLILGDGTTMTVTDPATAVGCSGTLTVFCQSAGTGTLAPSVDNGFAIRCLNYLQYGGQVTAVGAASGVRATEDIEIHGGVLTVTAGSQGLYARDSILITGGTVTSHASDEIGNGIYAKQNILISGGTVTATHDPTIAAEHGTAAGMKADLGTLTLTSSCTVTATTFGNTVVLSTPFAGLTNGTARFFQGSDTALADASVLDGMTLMPLYWDFILPENTLTVGESAFEGIDASCVYVPDGCQCIEDLAFSSCGNLKAVRLPASCASFSGNPFQGCGSVMIFCSDGSWLSEFCANNGCEFYLTEDGAD